VLHAFPAYNLPYVTVLLRSLAASGAPIHVVAMEREEDVHALEEALELLRQKAFIAYPSRRRWQRYALALFRILRLALSRPTTLFRASATIWNRERSLLEVIKHISETFPILRRPGRVYLRGGSAAARYIWIKEVVTQEVIVTFNGQDFSLTPDKYHEVLQRADRIHFLSRHIFELARSNGYDGSHFCLLPPPVDTRFFRAASRPSDQQTPRLLSVGRLVWQKGHVFGIRAARILKDRGHKFGYTVVGSGSYLEFLTYEIHRLGLEDTVRMLPWQPREDLRRLYQESEVYVHPSVEEGFSNSTIEAQASGLPVVATSVGGLSECVIHGTTGILVRPWDSESLASAIELLLREPRRARCMGEAAAAHAKSFDLDRLVPEYLRFLGELP
jgi:colanic acid/amylovoran biosynthesis glycosyltransferase